VRHGEEEDIHPHPSSCFSRARPAGLQLALLALEDEPVRAGVAEVAIPEDQRGVRLDHLEGVFAFAGLRHGSGLNEESQKQDSFLDWDWRAGKGGGI